MKTFVMLLAVALLVAFAVPCQAQCINGSCGVQMTYPAAVDCPSGTCGLSAGLRVQGPVRAVVTAPVRAVRAWSYFRATRGRWTPFRNMRLRAIASRPSGGGCCGR